MTLHHRPAAASSPPGHLVATPTATKAANSQYTTTTMPPLAKKQHHHHRRSHRFWCCGRRNSAIVIGLVTLGFVIGQSFLLYQLVRKLGAVDPQATAAVAATGSPLVLESSSTRPALLRKNASQLHHDDDNATATNPQQFERLPPASTQPKASVVPPLKPLDYEKFTVRVNTWKRPFQLRVVLTHLLTCPTVAQVQVVWCTAQGPVPDWLVQLSKLQQQQPQERFRRVVVEAHEDNSLNARFDVLAEPPTAGILNQDDDLIRPCDAMNVGFALWTRDPHRMVGFDARRATPPVAHDKRWTYGPLSQTTRTNQYSMALTRFAFVHVEHLRSYTHDMPAEIRQRVGDGMNCEDIAMSLWISHVTGGLVPLLADHWVLRLVQIKLSSASAISNSSNHTPLRNACVHDFMDLLHLKPSSDTNNNKAALQSAEWVHHRDAQGQPLTASASLLQCGAAGSALNANTTVAVQRSLLKRRHKWSQLPEAKILEQVQMMKYQAQVVVQQLLSSEAPAAPTAPFVHPTRRRRRRRRRQQRN